MFRADGKCVALELKKTLRHNSTISMESYDIILAHFAQSNNDAFPDILNFFLVIH